MVTRYFVLDAAGRPVQADRETWKNWLDDIDDGVIPDNRKIAQATFRHLETIFLDTTFCGLEDEAQGIQRYCSSVICSPEAEQQLLELGLPMRKPDTGTLLTRYYASERDAWRGHQRLCHFLAGAIRKLM
jgi:hypothetical protein